jgi:hypothetical protein
VSDRPLDNTSDEKKDFDIWYVERENKEGPWSEPVNLGAPVNTQLDEFYPSLALNDNLYLTMVAPDGTGKDDIYVCRWDGEKYSAPALLDSNINSTGYEFNAFISRNEDFLLYTRYNEKKWSGKRGFITFPGEIPKAIGEKLKTLASPLIPNTWNTAPIIMKVATPCILPANEAGWNRKILRQLMNFRST